jgi:hypothetical protein
VKPFTVIAILIFAVICVVHILRLFFGWTANINGVSIPVWVSVIAALASGVIAVMLWKENK